MRNKAGVSVNAREAARVTPLLARFAAEWAAALAGTSHVPMSSAEVAGLLRRHAAAVIAIASAVPFHPENAAEIGVAMVSDHFVGAPTLGRSLTVIGRHLPAALGDDLAPGRAERVSAVQEALAVGYVTELRDRTLAEQESIRRAEITARQRAEEALRGSEELFRAVFTEAAIGIGLADLEGHIVDTNPAFAAMLGYSRDEFRLLNVNDLIPDQPGMQRAYAALIGGKLGCFRTQMQYKRKDGSPLWTNLTASVINDQHGGPRYTLALVEDVSERQELEERLRHQALHDPLTGLPNRTLFFDRLTDALRDPDGRIGICYLDLDGFKGVNDTLGHATGDELLVAVARRLERRSDRRRPGLVARMGGDEFVMLIERSECLADIVALAGDVLARLARPFQIGRHRIHITASVGIVERPAAGTTAADVVVDADSALYWAKADGRGRWAIFDPARKAEDDTRRMLATSMHTALERGEFGLVYQPIVDLPHGVLRGAEALVRWNHPELGTLHPESFIALAEANGLIVPLGRWVAETACREASKWRAIRPESAPFISVNVSAVQAASTALADDLATILRDTELPPHMLQLELTESAIVRAGGRPLESLQKISGMGVQMAVDDFGTGYSNLAYLRRLPVDTLKLAGSFIREAWPEGAADEPIISSLVGLAHTLGLTVTAEGVETEEQAALLATLGCDFAQGWTFSRPLPAEHIATILRGTDRPTFGRPIHQVLLLYACAAKLNVIRLWGGER